MSLKKNSIIKFASIFLVFLTIFIALQAVLLLKNPPIWPDEVMLTDIANNWLNQHKLGTDLFLNTYTQANNRVYTYPPLYFYTQAIWLKLFGLSIASVRLFSLTFTFLFSITFFFLIKLFLKEKYPVKSKINPNLLALITLTALLIDPLFFQATHFARAEIVVLFWGTLGFYVFTRSKQGKNFSKVSRVLTLTTGILFSLAFLTHYIGAFFAFSAFVSLLLKEKLSIFKSESFYLLLISFLTIPIIWLATLLNNLEVVYSQTSLLVGTFAGFAPYITRLILGEPAIQLLLIIYILITTIFIVYVIRAKIQAYLPLCSLLTITWLTVIFAKEMWYFVYVIPWIYLSASILIYNLFTKPQKPSLKYTLIQTVGILFVINIALNIVLILNLVRNFSGDKYSYHDFTENIIKVIPKEKSIFLSTIPDPYFGLKTSPNKYTIYEFPIVKTPKENYLELLNKSDYIVYNGIYSVMTTDLLSEYINLNTQEIYNIEGKNQYQAQVIKLKPRNQRRSP